MSTSSLNRDLASVILLVDDDPDLRKRVSDFLASHGYQVHAVGSAAELRQVSYGAQ